MPPETQAVIIGAGAVGAVLARHLRERGVRVALADRRAAPMRDGGTPEWMVVDAADRADVRRLFHRHPARLVAYTAGVPAAVCRADPAGARAAHVLGAVQALHAAAEVGARRFLYVSSAAVYGRQPHLAALSETAQRLGDSPYAELKIDAENRLVAELPAGLELVIVRPAGLYGACTPHGSLSQRFLHSLIRAAQQQAPVVLPAPDTALDEFVHLEDAGQRLSSMLVSPLPSTSPVTVNLGAGCRTLVREIEDALTLIALDALTVQRGPAWAGFHDTAPLDCTRLWNWLGTHPRTTLQDGISSWARSLITEGARA